MIGVFNAMRLDVANNHIYWADGLENRIKRMNLDGTSSTVLVEQARDLSPWTLCSCPGWPDVLDGQQTA